MLPHSQAPELGLALPRQPHGFQQGNTLCSQGAADFITCLALTQVLLSPQNPEEVSKRTEDRPPFPSLSPALRAPEDAVLCRWGKYIWVPEPLVSPPEPGYLLHLTFSQGMCTWAAVPSIDKRGVTRFPARPPLGKGGLGAPGGPVTGFPLRGACLPHPCATAALAAVSDGRKALSRPPGWRSELHNHLLFYTCVTFNANFRTKLPVATDKIVSIMMPRTDLNLNHKSQKAVLPGCTSEIVTQGSFSLVEKWGDLTQGGILESPRPTDFKTEAAGLGTVSWEQSSEPSGDTSREEASVPAIRPGSPSAMLSASSHNCFPSHGYWEREKCISSTYYPYADKVYV